MGVESWGRTISLRASLISSPALQLWNNTPTYASTAYYMTFFISLDRVSTASLVYCLVWKSFEPRKNFPQSNFCISVFISNIHCCGYAISCRWNGNIILRQGEWRSNQGVVTRMQCFPLYFDFGELQ